MFDKGQTFALTLFVEMACNHRFGNGDDKHKGIHGPPQSDRQFVLQQCELARFNRTAWDFLWDLRVLFDLQDQLEPKSQRRLHIVRGLNAIVNVVDLSDEETFPKGLQLTKRLLHTQNARHDENDHTVFAVGHCHIDTAWLWPYGETRRKVIRSWASQLRLMQQYNGAGLRYHFAASQAQQFAWLREDCPSLFARLQAAAKAGEFHAVGGTWVEMDGNLPSGEAFVRQFLYGQEFFQRHFGRRCRVFWLPDTFGYSAQLPQIMRQSGVDFFLTQVEPHIWRLAFLSPRIFCRLAFL